MERIMKPKKFSIQDLEKGVEFEVDQDNLELNNSDEEFDEDYTTFKNDIVDIEGKNKPRFLGGSDVPFQVLKENMEPITEDGLVLKSVIQHGTGLPIPDKSVVMMHYEAFVEDKKEPIDSTRLRKKAFKFLIGDGNVLPGLELGIQTMKIDEIARIIAAPQYAFGSMGCPPRIPPNAEIMYEVEIINFYSSKDSIEFEDMSPEEQKKIPFEKLIGIYHTEVQMAKELFKRHQYGSAVARYRRAMHLLETKSVENEEQDDKRKECLLKLYLNLAQCYINMQMPKRAVTYASLGLKIDERNRKGLYRMGYALNMLSEYDDAEKYLNRVQRYYPNDKQVSNLILKLNEKRRQYKDLEKAFCKNAFGMSVDDEKKTTEFEESPEFIETIRDELKTFVDSEETELLFSPGYTENQLDVVKVLAQELDLAFVSKIQNDKKINKVAKRKLSS